jgi:hypothetical protein
LDIYNAGMNDSREVRIQYASKRSGIANGWKKSIGESRGIKRLKTVEKKMEFEHEFEEWVNSSDSSKEKYGMLLSGLSQGYLALTPLSLQLNYLRESILSIEIIRFARTFRELVEESNNKNTEQIEINRIAEKLMKSAEQYFKNYQAGIDKDIFKAMMADYCTNIERDDWPNEIKNLYDDHKGDFGQMAETVFSESLFGSEERVASLLNNYKSKNSKIVEKDIAYRIADGVVKYYEKNLMPGVLSSSAAIDSMMRIYMKAQMEMQPMKNFYPDANFTLRVAYGNVKGYQPDDAVKFRYFTTLEGILEKEDPEVYDYVVEDKLKELYKDKDFGPYADQDGSMHVCFTATNHTSGGNSGSPVLDADGNLIGLNFDRCWEGTMSDLDYDISQCRNIALDIRYCLFIIDKFAGATHLVDEMTLLNVNGNEHTIKMN